MMKGSMNYIRVANFQLTTGFTPDILPVDFVSHSPSDSQSVAYWLC